MSNLLWVTYPLPRENTSVKFLLSGIVVFSEYVLGSALEVDAFSGQETVFYEKYLYNMFN